MPDAGWLALVVVLLAAVAVAWFGVRGSRQTRGSHKERATHRALRTANLAAPVLRAGLTRDTAQQAVPLLRSLLGGRGLVLADARGLLAAEGVDAEHLALVARLVGSVLDRGEAVAHGGLPCSAGAGCRYQAAVAVPVRPEKSVVAALVVLGPTASPGLVRLSAEVAQLVATQLELAELDRSRRRAELAELRFLRAQISPHFVYNALTAIASYVRTDPERARQLLLGFADFTRDSFRDRSPWASVADELRLVDAYLDLERARFGDQLNVSVAVTPEVLGVSLPSLTLQPLVENAVRHGLEPREGRGRVMVAACRVGGEVRMVVEDDGVGADPTLVRRVLDGDDPGDSVGLHNVDERLRAAFGDDHGLLVRTAPGAGMTVTLRLPLAAGTADATDAMATGPDATGPDATAGPTPVAAVHVGSGRRRVPAAGPLAGPGEDG